MCDKEVFGGGACGVCYLLFLFYLIFMCMGVLPVCIFMHDISAYYLLRLEEGFPSPEAGVTDGSELPSRC